MSLFPTFIQTDVSLKGRTEKLDIPREYELNFETGQLTGRIVEGIAAVKIWIWLALKTTRFRHAMFTWDYGTEIEGLIGQGYSEEHVETEVFRMVSETMSVNRFITGITNFSATVSGDELEISFIVNTLYGEVEAYV